MISNHEKKVGAILTSKGFETYVPLHKFRRQWSDRIKIQYLPLFSGWVFFPLRVQRQSESLKYNWTSDDRPTKISGEDIYRLKRILSIGSDLLIESTLIEGEVVEVVGKEFVRGVLLERGLVCRVRICLDSVGRVISLVLPA